MESRLITIITGFPSLFVAWTSLENGMIRTSLYPACFS
jgi:hypothetical protein